MGYLEILWIINSTFAKGEFILFEKLMELEKLMPNALKFNV